MDICEIILDQHHQQRRLFAVLEEYPRDDVEGLDAIWRQLESLLELHAEAEELYYYPELVKLGTGAADAESTDEEVQDALKDHNELRDAIASVRKAKAGSDEWFTAVVNANTKNSDHMAEEERQDLADFRQQASLELRHEIAVRFLKHVAQHQGERVSGKNKDPKGYLADKQQEGTTETERAAAEKRSQETAERVSSDPEPSVKATESAS